MHTAGRMFTDLYHRAKKGSSNQTLKMAEHSIVFCNVLHALLVGVASCENSS